MSDPPKTTALSRKRTERLSPDPPDNNQPTSKKARLGPSQSFADVLEDMSSNDASLAGPHPASSIDSNKEGVRVLIHVTNLLTVRGQSQSGRTLLPVERFLCHYKVQAMSWMELPVGKYQAVEGSETLSHSQAEFTIKHEDIIFHPEWNKSTPLKILSFDIETRVPVDMTFTKYHQRAEMPVIQIGNIIQLGKDHSYRSVFTFRGCAEITGAEVRSFPDEASMLLAWKQFIITSDPDLITGFNTACFDFIYLLLRAEALEIPDFACLGRLKGLESIAHKVAPGVDRTFRDAPVLAGRLQIDIFQYIREKNIRAPLRITSFSLNGVSSHFLSLNKEDLSFRIINSLQDGDDNDRKRLAVYCLKDAHLPLELLNCAGLKCLEEAITAARNPQCVHLPFGDFLRMGRN
ncbi:ribonuclease H-like domain-containing protein [Mycena latifolia]|nr:ribonuclease H-like domain-containing protein [Mycena latifolia]